MYLENIVFDSVNPSLQGKFWQELLGCQLLSESTEGFETRLSLGPGYYLDLCFQKVPEAPKERERLTLGCMFPGRRTEDNEPGPPVTDPQGNKICVVHSEHAALTEAHLDSILIESADPERDCNFWQWLTGWEKVKNSPIVLRHVSQRGPRIVFHPQHAGKGDSKNRMHLDLRLVGDDHAAAVEAEILARGGQKMITNWGELPWTSYLDPSGNEFCVLKHLKEN